MLPFIELEIIKISKDEMEFLAIRGRIIFNAIIKKLKISVSVSRDLLQ